MDCYRELPLRQWLIQGVKYSQSTIALDRSNATEDAIPNFFLSCLQSDPFDTICDVVLHLATEVFLEDLEPPIEESTQWKNTQ